MSILAQAIEAVQTKNKHYKMPLLVSVVDETTLIPKSFAVEYLQEYRLEAKFGLKMFSDPVDDIEHARKLKQCRAQIIEAVFGEFREDFMSMFTSLSARNVDEAYDKLEKFYHKMYKVEE